MKMRPASPLHEDCSRWRNFNLLSHHSAAGWVSAAVGVFAETHVGFESLLPGRTACDVSP